MEARIKVLYRTLGYVEEWYRVREIRDLDGPYHDSIEVALFIPWDVPISSGAGRA